MTEDHVIIDVQLDERTILWRNADIEQERRVAIFDLLETNSFKPLTEYDDSYAGPYKIVMGVAKTTQAISDISRAANEQLLSAREVSTAIQYIAEETEKSASACDSIARSTDALNDRAGNLNQTVSGFVV